MDIELIRGDSEVLDITVTDAVDEAVNLTGADIWFTVKKRKSDPDDNAVISKRTGDGIVVVDPATGVLAVTLTPDDTDLVPGSYRYDVQVKDANGRVSTVADGRARVRADVTRATV